MKTNRIAFLLLTAMLLTGCQRNIMDETEQTPVTETTSLETVDTTNQEFEIPVETEPVEIVMPEEPEPVVEEEILVEVPEETQGEEPAVQPMTNLGVVMPKTDGSTSTLPFDIAVHAALLDTPQEELTWVAHTKTYTALDNLIAGKVDVLFRTPLSAKEREKLKEAGFSCTEEPVAGEGFVFVVNAENPVDSLTSDQLRAIYAGEITNWSQVGGEDLPIIAYQRNQDSGSQNYMIAFMGNTPLMRPITDTLPASMTGLMDAVANYENSRGAIGYSVYSYSDGMYEDTMKIKHLQVDGVAPSFENMANGTYPLLGYNYAVFNANLPDDAPVRTVVQWIQSDAGQQVIAAAGYVPYRHMDGLTLPEMVSPQLYLATGTGAPLTDTDYDYKMSYTSLDQLPTFTNGAVDKTIRDYIAAEQARINAISDEEVEKFLSGRQDDYPTWNRRIHVSMTNGYMSILSGIEYCYGYQDSQPYYYKPAGAVFDMYTGERLAFSDLFPAGSDFVPMLNTYLAGEAITPYSGFGIRHTMVRDFTALEEDKFVWTADQIVFLPGDVFADGVALSLDGIHEEMSVSVPRDMSDLFKDTDEAVYRIIRLQGNQSIGYGITRYTGEGTAERGNEVTLWLLDEKKCGLDSAIVKKMNDSITALFEDNYQNDNLLSLVEKAGYLADTIERMYIGPWADFDIVLYGKRYLEVGGPNEMGIVRKEEYQAEENEHINLSIVPDGYDHNPYYFTRYYSAKTGDAVTMAELFSDGWQATSSVYGGIYNPYGETKPVILGTYADIIGDKAIEVVSIAQYYSAPGHSGTVADLLVPASVTFVVEGEIYTVDVERGFIW